MSLLPSLWHRLQSVWLGHSWRQQASAIAKRMQRDWAALPSLGFLLGLAFLFHFLNMNTFSLSVDDEYSAYRQDPQVWIQQGRWLVYWLERGLITQPTVPYFSALLFCFLATSAYSLVIRAHHMTSSAGLYLAFPLFCAYPVWGFIAEFYGNLPSAALGLFFAALAGYFFALGREAAWAAHLEQKPYIRPASLPLAASILALAFAIGSYQSFLLFFLAHGLGLLIWSPRLGTNGFERYASLKELGLLAAVTLLGLGLYSAIQATHLRLFGLTNVYIGQFYQPEALLRDGAAAGRRILRLIEQAYLGKSRLLGRSISGLFIVSLLGTISLVARTAGSSRRFLDHLPGSLLVAGFLSTPFPSTSSPRICLCGHWLDYPMSCGCLRWARKRAVTG